jgi:hypothetical protein
VGGPDVAVEGQTEEENHAGDRRADVPDSFRQMLSEYQVEFDAKRAERRRLADNPREVENVSTWVREMGWAEHFAGKDKTAIHLASMMPRSAAARADARQRNGAELEVDPQLSRLGVSFDRVVERCSARLKLVPHETLRWVG